MVKGITLFFLMIACCDHAFGQRVEVEQDKTVDLSRYTTFLVPSGDLVLVMDANVNQDALKGEISQAITGTLAEKGYNAQQDSSADFSITFVAEIVERVEHQELGPLGQMPARTGADLDPDRSWSQEVRTGSLAIEVVEIRSGRSVWRSSSSINFRSSDLVEVLQAAVIRSLRKFPKAKK